MKKQSIKNTLDPVLSPDRTVAATGKASIYLFGLPDAARKPAGEAARLAFPMGDVKTVQDVSQIYPRPGARCLVVLGGSELAAGLVAEAGEIPRWAVVVLGGETSEVADTVPPADWNAPLLARVFRSVVLQHELLCENLRLRGDLKTVARRITHDLRTPIGCIQTTSFLLKDLDPSSLTEMVGVIQQSSVEIAQIIDRVSFVLRASAEPSSTGPIGMGPLVATTLRQLEEDIKAAGAVVTQPEAWPAVTGVASWLQVVWWNLLSNALRHAGPAPKIKIGWKASNGDYRFSVTDRGPGVPPDRLAGLFSSFDQLHGRQTTGLGLSIAHRLVELQNGSCGYERAGKSGGACFYFTLPAVESAK